MSSTGDTEVVTVKSTRFGEFTVPKDSLIHFPSGLIGFPRAKSFVILEHKPPFSWLHSIEDPNLAFVVIDGAEFGPIYEGKIPYGDRDTELEAGDDYAILIVVTARPDPLQTTANLKAPLFVNVRNKKGVQIIFDDARLSTRHQLWEKKEDIPTSEASDDTGEKK